MHEKLPDPVPAPEDGTDGDTPCNCSCKTPITDTSAGETGPDFTMTYSLDEYDPGRPEPVEPD